MSGMLDGVGQVEGDGAGFDTRGHPFFNGSWGGLEVRQYLCIGHFHALKYYH